jgi:hypothetical protein
MRDSSAKLLVCQRLEVCLAGSTLRSAWRPSRESGLAGDRGSAPLGEGEAAVTLPTRWTLLKEPAGRRRSLRHATVLAGGILTPGREPSKEWHGKRAHPYLTLNVPR